MSLQPIPDLTPGSYRQKMSWIIKKEDWEEYGDGEVSLELKSAIPGTVKTHDQAGGSVGVDNQRIIFVTDWPLDLDLKFIQIHAEYKLKTSDGTCVVGILGQTVREVDVFEESDFKTVELSRFLTLNTALLFEKDGFFILEADLAVEVNINEDGNSVAKKSNSFAEEIKSFFDETNTDVVVISKDKEFKCHKAILGARSEVFKNTFAHNTIESATNTIVIYETPAQAVEDMLKYIYSGDVPEDPKSLTTDLLHIADMYQLQPVVEACVKNLVDSLEVSSCIPTLVLVDRYQPQDQNMREMVITFMKCKAMEVVEEEDWVKLMNRSPGLAQKVVRALAREAKEKHKCGFCIVSYY